MARQPRQYTVYLLHFSEPIGSEAHRAQHYIGATADVNARLGMHQHGQGAHITRAVVAEEKDLLLARQWQVQSGRWNDVVKLEQNLKARKNAKMLCPICTGEAAWRRAAIVPRTALPPLENGRHE